MCGKKAKKILNRLLTMKIALVHDHLIQDGGAEHVLRVFQEMWPDAPTYTLLYDPKRAHPAFGNRDIRTSFLQKMPFSLSAYKAYLPLMPIATERHDLSEYDVVLSSSSAFSKGVITKPETMHICYCHTPTRYLWSDTHSYVKDLHAPGFVKSMLPFSLTKLRLWDRWAADRVDRFIANSNNVQERIKKYYRRLERKLSQVKRALKPTDIKPAEPTEIDKNAPTAAIFVNEDTGVGIYTFLNINNLFPKHYKNYIFIQVGVVDAKSLGAQRKLSFMKKKVEKNLEFFVSYARSFGFSAKAYAEFDTNAVQKLYELADEVHKEYPNTVFYCGRIVYQIENIFTRLLHSDIPTELQQKLHYHNMQMIILPAQLQSVTAEEEGVAHV